MTKCDFCKRNNGDYLMSNVCCASRYMMTQALDSRREYLARWERRHGSAATATLKTEVARAWAARK